MDPILGGIISGGASLLGSIFSSQTSSQNVDKQLQFAQQQQNWQTEMANTAYQRSSQDMQKAGLNPAMMFGSGSAAATPGQIAAPNFSAKQSPMAGLGHAVEQGVATMATAKTVDKMTDEMANLKTQNDLLRKQIEQVGVSMGLTKQQTQTEAENTGRMAAERKLAQLGIPIKGISAVEADAILDLPDAVVRRAAQAVYATGKFGDVAGNIGQSARSILELISGLKSGKRGLSASETRDLYNRFESWRR